MRLKTTLYGLMATIFAAPAMAQEALEIVGQPKPRGLGFQPAATELARDLQWLDGMILAIITIITVFVTALMVYCIIRFNRRANPTPGTFTHNSPIEVAWTIIPIVVLVLIGAFSLPILFKQQEIPQADITIKVTGYQWYWGYEYVDHEFGFDSFMLAQDELEGAGYGPEQYLLATDTAVVVPIGKTIVMNLTGADVIHSWAIPAFGVKQDAVPGRISQLWFAAEKEGIYFGQCSELCGKDHSYMPITIKVVSEEAYAKWLNGAIEEYAGLAQSFDVAAAE